MLKMLMIIHSLDLLDAFVEVVRVIQHVFTSNGTEAKIVLEEHPHYRTRGPCHIDWGIESGLLCEISESAAVVEVEVSHEQQIDL